jgi:hypothetical protein
MRLDRETGGLVHGTTAAASAFTVLLRAPVETLADAAFMLSVLPRGPSDLDLGTLPPGSADALLAVLATLERQGEVPMRHLPNPCRRAGPLFERSSFLWARPSSRSPGKAIAKTRLEVQQSAAAVFR